MGEKLLIDSDILIDCLRGHKPAIAFLKSAQGSIAAITHAELLAGKANSTASVRLRVLSMLERFESIPLNSHVATLAGDIERNHSIGLADATIAATALIHNLSLASRNIKHFACVSGLKVKVPY